MALDIYFSDDIRNALLAADEASASAAEFAARLRFDPTMLNAYMEGYRAALATVALAFGLPPIAAVSGRRQSLEVAGGMVEMLRE